MGSTQPLPVPGIEEVRITAKTDQLLEPLPEGASYLGFIFARAPNSEIGRRRIKGSHARLRFEIAAPIALVTGYASVRCGAA